MSRAIAHFRSNAKAIAAMSAGILIGVSLASRAPYQAHAQAPAPSRAESTIDSSNPLAPEVVDPEHYKVEIDNQYVRVIRCKIPQGDSVKMHHHPVGSVIVLLEDQNLKQTDADGTVREVHNKAKRVSWGSPATHMGQNIGDHLYEYVRVDIKAAH